MTLGQRIIIRADVPPHPGNIIQGKEYLAEYKTTNIYRFIGELGDEVLALVGRSDMGCSHLKGQQWTIVNSDADSTQQTAPKPARVYIDSIEDPDFTGGWHDVTYLEEYPGGGWRIFGQNEISPYMVVRADAITEWEDENGNWHSGSPGDCRTPSAASGGTGTRAGTPTGAGGGNSRGLVLDADADCDICGDKTTVNQLDIQEDQVLCYKHLNHRSYKQQTPEPADSNSVPEPDWSEPSQAEIQWAIATMPGKATGHQTAFRSWRIGRNPETTRCMQLYNEARAASEKPQWLLRSVTAEYHWPTQSPVIAVDDASARGNGKGPGVYGKTDPEEVDTTDGVVGEIAVWGDIVWHTAGCRARYAYPLRLYVSDVLTNVELKAQSLRQAYGCPVEVGIPEKFRSRIGIQGFGNQKAGNSAIQLQQASQALQQQHLSPSTYLEVQFNRMALRYEVYRGPILEHEVGAKVADGASISPLLNHLHWAGYDLGEASEILIQIWRLRP